MTTFCSNCNVELVDDDTKEFLICKTCNRFTPRNVPQELPVTNCLLTKSKSTGYNLICITCNEVKKTNYTIYKNLKSQNKLDSYVCRNCKKVKNDKV